VKVLQIHNRYRERGGEDSVVDAEAELLRSAGHDVYQFQVENPAGNIRAAGALTLASWNPSAARRVSRVAASFRPDIAHVHNTWYTLSLSVLRALQRTHTPVVMTLHNYRLMCANGQLLRQGKPCELCVGASPMPGIRYRCYRGSVLASTAAAGSIALHRHRDSLGSEVDRFIAMSEFAMIRYVAAGLPPDRIDVKPHFVKDPGRRNSPPSASQTVLYVGRLSPEKGLEVLLDAWAVARPGDLRLELIGDGPLRAHLEGRCVPGVSILGHLNSEDVRQHLVRARTVVQPSLSYETFGLSAAEALAAGTPVLGSDLGVTAERVGSLGSRWLVPPGDVAAWTSALAGLTDGNAVNEAGRLGRSTFERHCDPEQGLRRLESVYVAALKHHRGKAPAG